MERGSKDKRMASEGGTITERDLYPWDTAALATMQHHRLQKTQGQGRQIKAKQLIHIPQLYEVQIIINSD